MKVINMAPIKNQNGDFQKVDEIHMNPIMIVHCVNFQKKQDILSNSVVNIRNIVPFEETFTGSNYNSYKHKYFLMFMDYQYVFRTSSVSKNRGE
jgi:hypothetical protein